jgi:hypothetical protein
MTYQNDPDINHRRPVTGRKDSTVLWITGAVAALAVIGLVAWGMSDNNRVADTNTNRPAANQPATTGTAATTPPATTQQKPVTTPAAPAQNAPATPPANNR